MTPLSTGPEDRARAKSQAPSGGEKAPAKRKRAKSQAPSGGTKAAKDGVQAKPKASDEVTKGSTKRGRAKSVAPLQDTEASQVLMRAKSQAPATMAETKSTADVPWNDEDFAPTEPTTLMALVTLPMNNGAAPNTTPLIGSPALIAPILEDVSGTVMLAPSNQGSSLLAAPPTTPSTLAEPVTHGSMALIPASQELQLAAPTLPRFTNEPAFIANPFSQLLLPSIEQDAKINAQSPESNLNISEVALSTSQPRTPTAEIDVPIPARPVTPEPQAPITTPEVPVNTTPVGTPAYSIPDPSYRNIPKI